MSDKRYEVLFVALSDLKPHPKRDYYKTRGLEFVNSIRSEGIRDPIKVQRGTNIIIGGHTRVESATQAGLTEVPVIYFDLDDDAAEDLLIRDNAQRSGEEVDLIKLARSIQSIMDLNGINPSGGRPSTKPSTPAASFRTRADVAALFKMSEGKLKETVSLLRLVPELQSLVSMGKVCKKAGTILASLGQAQQLAYYQRIKEEAQRPGFTVRKSDAEAYREACKLRTQKSNNPGTGDHIDFPKQTGEFELDLSNISLSDVAESVHDVQMSRENAKNNRMTVPSLFTDETAHIVNRVNDRFLMEGVVPVELNATKAAQVEKVSNAFSEQENRLAYKNSVAKHEIDRARSTLVRLESELPAVFSVDLFKDVRSPLPSDLEAIHKILERFIEKVEVLQGQFRQ